MTPVMEDLEASEAKFQRVDWPQEMERKIGMGGRRSTSKDTGCQVKPGELCSPKGGEKTYHQKGFFYMG